MHARITLAEMRPDAADKAAKIYRESVEPACRKQHGFRGAYMMQDRQTGKGMAITLWDTEADMHAGEASGFYKEQVDKFKELYTKAPERLSYEVTVHPEAAKTA